LPCYSKAEHYTFHNLILLEKRTMKTEAISEPLAVDLIRLAPRVSLHLRTLRTMDSLGDIPGGFWCGRRRLFRMEIVRQWIAQGMPGKAEWQALVRDKVVSR
jgi:hypothetical protein